MTLLITMSHGCKTEDARMERLLWLIHNLDSHYAEQLHMEQLHYLEIKILPKTTLSAGLPSLHVISRRTDTRTVVAENLYGTGKSPGA